MDLLLFTVLLFFPIFVSCVSVSLERAFAFCIPFTHAPQHHNGIYGFVLETTPIQKVFSVFVR